MSLTPCPIEEEVGQVVEAADDRVVHPLGGAVPWRDKNKPPSSEVFFNFRTGTLELFRCARGRTVEFVPGFNLNLYIHRVSPAFVSPL